MSLIQLFSKNYYPQLRAYTLLLAGLIAGGGVAVNLLGSDDSSKVNKQEVIWVHSPEIFWEKSPVNVKKGDVIFIQACGKYHLNIDTLFEDPSMRDAFSSGINGLKKHHLARDIHKRLIYNRANYGQLLMHINASNTKPERIPNEPFVLQEGQNEFEAETSGTLWFSTNQPIFYPYKNDDWQLYTTYSGQSLSLDNFQDEKPEPFFENNFGQLILSIEVR